MAEWYKISEGELVELIHDSLKLMALENGGVDNWDWYDASICDFEDKNGELYTVAYEKLSNYDIIKE